MMRFVQTTIKVVIVVLFLGLMSVVAVQVFARYFLPQSPSWTEELARFLMLYLVAAGAGLAFSKSMFISVDLFVQGQKNPPFFSRVLRIVSRIVIFFSMISIGVFSWNMMKLGITQASAALHIPMIFIFVIMAIIPLSIVSVQLYQLLHCLQRKRKE